MSPHNFNVEHNALDKISGTISEYKCNRQYASFVYSGADQERLGAIAIIAAAAGMGGQATSAASFATSIEEEADYVEFNLNGKPVKGWVWRSPFENGDLVEVAAEWQQDHYEAYGIARPADKLIALYPHCSRTRIPHIRNAVKWWAISNTAFFGLLLSFLWNLGGRELVLRPGGLWLGGPVALMFVLMCVSLVRQYMPFVRVSEQIFLSLGLPDASNIDLVKSSKLQRTPTDAPEFGTFYFRY